MMSEKIGIEIHVGDIYLVRNLSDKMKGNGVLSTNVIEEVAIVNISPNKQFIKSIKHGWFSIDLLEIVDILERR